MFARFKTRWNELLLMPIFLFVYCFSQFTFRSFIRSLVRWLVRLLACLCSLNTCVSACFLIAILRFSCTHVWNLHRNGRRKRESARRERDESEHRMSIRSQIVAVWLAVGTLVNYKRNMAACITYITDWRDRNRGKRIAST